ncbi:MAG TPA: isoprenylcysteine carboxylmethyltransferase family protein [Myxococcales bacterium]|jgi:protein-S-isoprenylcysteine O-methyltransferase Ste14
MTAQAATAHQPAGTRLLEMLMGSLRPLLLLLMVAVMFAAAGSARWGPGWRFIAALFGLLAFNAPVLLLTNREIVKERLKTHRDTEPFDRTFAALDCLGLLALVIVAGLDAGRFGWAVLPPWLAWTGVALMAAGDLLCLWAMRTNRFVETTVRIQEDRGHQVITTGPYHYVRHPMYAGFIPMTAGMALVLESAWALVPAALLCGLVIWRLLREERVLAARLPGYTEYMAETRWRLVPGIW